MEGKARRFTALSPTIVRMHNIGGIFFWGGLRTAVFARDRVALVACLLLVQNPGVCQSVAIEVSGSLCYFSSLTPPQLIILTRSPSEAARESK